MFKQEFLGSGMCADGAAILSCCNSSGEIITMREMLGKYRIHSGNDTAPVDTVDTAVASRECLIRFAESINVSDTNRFWTVYWCIDGLIYQLTRLWLKKNLKNPSIKKLQTFYLEHQDELERANSQGAIRERLLLQFKFNFFAIILGTLIRFKLI